MGHLWSALDTSTCQISLAVQPDMADVAPTAEQLDQWLKCGVCDVDYQITPDNFKKYRVKDHCFSCSSKVRNILMKPADESVKNWFKGLKNSDLPEYRKIVLEADSSKGAGGSTYLTASKFNVAVYKQTHEEQRGGKLKAGWTLMPLPWYKETVLNIRCVCVGDQSSP